MKKRTFFVYVAYVWTKTLLGLTFHPYISVRETVRRPILIPVLISPLIALGILFITAKFASLFVVVYDLTRELIGLFLSTVFISIVLWQMLLLYLLISFLLASIKKR